MTTETNVAAQAGDEPMPCPFCAFDESRVEAYSVQPDNFHSAYVQCDQCDARGPNALTVDGWLPSKGEAIAEAIKAWNSQVSPRATADVERNLRAELINAGALRQYCHNDGSVGFVTAYDFDITNRFLAAIATTKPGA